MLRKINEINAYHGTSYNFDRFNHKKYLNTGDGSQSFGWGTYITDNEDIAEEYGARSMESNTGTYDKDGNRLTAEMLTNIANEVFSDANIIKDVVNKIRMSMYGKGALSEDDLITLKEEFVEKYPRMTDAIEQFFTILQNKSLRFVKANNYVYEVDIPDYDGSNYIMWLEKPNDQLLHRLEKGFEKLKRKYPSVNDLELENVESGRDIYTMLNDILGTPKAASLFLFNMCGIEGIIYPIGTIFGYEGEEGNNYVIFDANKVKIVNKEIMENKHRVINEYTSRYYEGKQNFNIKAYHNTTFENMRKICLEGRINPKAYHSGECPWDIIWFTIGDDYATPYVFSYQIDEKTFKEKNFEWQNDIHLTTPNSISLLDKRLRIEKIKGVLIDELFERLYGDTQEEKNKFWDVLFKLSNGELGSEAFVMKILQQYNLKIYDFFGEDGVRNFKEEGIENIEDYNSHFVWESKHRVINEYTSRYYEGKQNFNIKAYHNTNLYNMCDVCNSGYIDPEAYHKGECKWDVIWFTINKDDYATPYVFSYQINEATFDEKRFTWQNDSHLTTPNRIDLMDKRLRIEKINGVYVDNIFKKFYGDTLQEKNKFWDTLFEITDYELSSEEFIMKIIQQYGLKRSDYFTDDESQSIEEQKIRESENNVVYYGVFIDDESKGKLSSFIPDDAYKVFCDHMTIAFKTQFTEEIVSYCEEMLGEEVELTATHIGMTEDVIAVAVETECESLNNTKHITLCTLSPKGRPVQSNNITDWQPLPTPITLHGTVKAFPFNMTEDKKYVRQGIIPYGDGECCIGENEERLNEVEASDISLKSFEIQDDLNPKFWINNKLNSRIRLKLLDLADEFIDTLAVDWVKPEDIVLTGSIANYNWSKYSDVDVHILIDYKKVWKKTEFVQDYFDSKKELWTQEHGELRIYGFPVEMYVEDTNADNPSSGVYSLNENKWIKEPNDFQDAELNENYIKRISAKIMTAIDNIEDKIKEEKDNHKLETSSEKLKKLFDKLHKQRQESLDKHGEMGTYNIIWKVLRRSGYLDKIWDIINNVYNKVNSIK